jgi:hypothetical protein
VAGWRTELSLYDFAFQPDGQNWVMNGDGSNPQPITDTMWEDACPYRATVRGMASSS